jgi:uncharacterized Zn-finger protein
MSTCPHCEYTSKYKMKLHIKQVHDKIKDHPCNRCHSAFSTNSDLTCHIKAVHDKIKDYICNDCEKAFSTNSKLQRHMKQVHDKIKDNLCNDCDAAFSTNGALTCHIKQVHDRIKDHICTRCDAAFSTNGNLDCHIKMVHDRIKDHPCIKCDAAFATNGNLKCHIKQVHDRIKDNVCNECSIAFSLNSDLKRHINVCTGKLNISSMEYNMINALDKLKIKYLHNTTHNKLKGLNGTLRFDFILPKEDTFVMIEMNGRQHYEPVCFGGTSMERALENFERQTVHDEIKRMYCADNGFELIEIKYDDRREYAEIIKSTLSERYLLN